LLKFGGTIILLNQKASELVMWRYWSAVSQVQIEATSVYVKKAPIVDVLYLLAPRSTVKQTKSVICGALFMLKIAAATLSLLT
jgi:hypothetical protein